VRGGHDGEFLRVDDLRPRIVDAKDPPDGRFEAANPGACFGAMEHVILMAAVAIAVLAGWLVSVVVRRATNRGRSGRDRARDRNPTPGIGAANHEPANARSRVLELPAEEMT
jgi:hypothetical protein